MLLTLYLEIFEKVLQKKITEPINKLATEVDLLRKEVKELQRYV